MLRFIIQLEFNFTDRIPFCLKIFDTNRCCCCCCCCFLKIWVNNIDRRLQSSKFRNRTCSIRSFDNSIVLNWQNCLFRNAQWKRHSYQSKLAPIEKNTKLHTNSLSLAEVLSRLRAWTILYASASKFGWNQVVGSGKKTTSEKRDRMNDSDKRFFPII